MIKKMFYALLLISLAENKEQMEYAQHVASEIVCKLRRKSGAYTISKHDEKMLKKYFDIKFEGEI